MYTVYRYLDKDMNVIYVGKSINLHARVITHKAQDEWNKYAEYIQYIELGTEKEMNDVEKYYIKLFKPKYNTQFVNSTSINITRNDIWINYFNSVNDIRKLIEYIKDNPEDKEMLDKTSKLLLSNKFDFADMYSIIPDFVFKNMLYIIYGEEFVNKYNIKFCDPFGLISISTENVNILYFYRNFKIYNDTIELNHDNYIKGLHDAEEIIKVIENLECQN